MLNVNDVTRLYLGIQGENEAQTITIDVAPWLVAHPGGSVTIWHKRNGDEVPAPTGAVFDDEAGTVSWTPTSTDTYVSGEGEAEIRLTEGTVIKKSRTVKTGVSPAVTGAGVPLGSDWQSYINAVDAIRSAAVTAKQAAESAASDSEAYAIGKRGGESVESDDPAYHNNSLYYEGLAAGYATDAENARDEILNMSVSAEQLPEGSSPTVAYAEGHMEFGIPKGDHAYITSETELYQLSASGTVVPSGTWLDSRPNLVQGQFLWIKRTRVWSGGTTTTSYEAYYTAVDGESSTLTIDDQPTQGSQGVPRSGGTYTMIQTKAAKVANATSGNFAGLDGNGDLTDSGKKASDFATAGDLSTLTTTVNGKADKADTVLTTTLSRGRKENTTVGTGSFAFGSNVTASGYCSHAEGSQTTASDQYSHAEGSKSIASGSESHAEGNETTASGYDSHSEGSQTTASGGRSHAEGYGTTASGSMSHAEGYSTTAQRKSQHVSGEFNVPDTSGTTSTRGDFAEIIGNGTADNARSNARALDWDGNEYLKGDLYVGCDSSSENGVKVLNVNEIIALVLEAIGAGVTVIDGNTWPRNYEKHQYFYKTGENKGLYRSKGSGMAGDPVSMGQLASVTANMGAVNDLRKNIGYDNSSAYMNYLDEDVTAGNTFTAPYSGIYTLYSESTSNSTVASWSLKSYEHSYERIAGSPKNGLAISSVFLKQGTILYTRSGSAFSYKVLNCYMIL